MSSNDSLAAKTEPKAKGRPHGRWTFWRVLRWGVTSCLIIVLIAAAYVWQNRYSFLEDTLKDILAEQGLDADLSIKNIKKTQADLVDITITADGTDVFSAKTLALEYDWREALEGRMKRIELTGAQLSLTVDEKGGIIDGWMPASDPDSQLVLPPGGLHLNDSRVKVQSPYGLVNAKGNLTLLSFEDIIADITVNPSSFSFGALEVKGGGKIDARIRPGENAITAALDFTDMVHPLAELSYANVKADVTFDLVDGLSHVSGPLTLNFARLSSGALAAENGKLSWDGSFSVRPDSSAIRQADGHWSGDVSRLTYADTPGRAKLASVLTLNDAMKAAPVTTHFADSLTKTVQDLLVGADVRGEGQFLRAGDKVEVKLTGPLSVKSKAAALKLSAVNDAAFYDYNRETESIKIAADAAMTGERSVSLKDMRLEAISPNGLTISGVSRFAARAETESEWRATSDLGDVRLAPMRVEARYVNEGARRDMSAVVSALDYDGPLPGGYAQQLQTAGVLSIDLRGDGLKTTFSPQEGSRITAAKFETAAGWIASDAAFDLVSGAPFYTRGAESDDEGGAADLAARLENITALLTERETGRALALELEAADVQSAINGERQDWTLGLFGAVIKTDDFGGAGTIVGAQEAVLRASLAPDSAMQIDLQSGAARVKTDQISTDNMQISLNGTPTNFHLDFGGQTYASAGKVAFIGQQLPQLPLRGALDYAGGQITGEAYTVLPDAEDADIDVTFEMKDGNGTAKIDIPRLTFTPKGLQPQNLVSALQGKIANVSGAVSASIDLAFSPDAPLQSFGRAVINNLDFGTLPGPFRGVSTEVEFSSVFPLVTSGVQRLIVDSFNPGVDLVDGVIEYELVTNGVEILSAKWPIANGFITVDPTVWEYDAPENRVVLRIDDVSVGAFLGEAGKGGLTVTGDVVGVIPVVVAGVDVSIDEGRLSVENGGVIQYRAQELTSVVDLIPEKYVTLQDYNQFKEFQKKDDPNENAGKDLAFTALRNFEYKSLSAKLDGPLDGEIEVNVRFIGRNPKILAGTEFDFNITVIGELVNLVRSLKPDSSMERLKGYMDLEGSEREEAMP